MDAHDDHQEDVLMRCCPVCESLYAEHSLDSLAWCMEQVADMLDFEPFGEESWRPTETVTGPTLERVL